MSVLVWTQDKTVLNWTIRSAWNQKLFWFFIKVCKYMLFSPQLCPQYVTTDRSHEKFCLMSAFVLVNSLLFEYTKICITTKEEIHYMQSVASNFPWQSSEIFYLLPFQWHFKFYDRSHVCQYGVLVWFHICCILYFIWVNTLHNTSNMWYKFMNIFKLR